MRRAGLSLLIAYSLLTAQTPPATLQYEGKPLTVPFKCTDDDMSWAGLSCSEEEPCPVYLELSAVESSGSHIFLIGNLHSQTVTLYSVLLGSEDGGKTWRELAGRTRGAGLDHIQFIDFETGWVSGQALSPLPQDPFLLLTTDGGKTWRNHPLFSETRVGSIVEFWFSSKNNGSLILDRGQGSEGSRYELYESPNAGETWMVRQTSDKLLKVKRTGQMPAGYRIRPDAPSKSFRIERQERAERWTTVAAFSVPAGACVPAPPKETPEPTTEPADPLEKPATGEFRIQSTPPSLKRPPK